MKVKAKDFKGSGKGEGGTGGGFVKKKRNVNEQARPGFVGKYDKWRGNLWDQANSDENWDPTVFQADMRENYELENEEWKFDNIPEIMDGMNIADWIDPEIMEKLRRLEEMEEEREEEEEKEREEDEEKGRRFVMTAEEEEEWKKMSREKKMAKKKHDWKQGGEGENLIPRAKRREGRGIEDFEKAMEDEGVDGSLGEENEG